MNKQQLGAFYTTEVDSVLKGYEHIVHGKEVVDLYAGNRDLLRWAVEQGAANAIGYDVNPDAHPRNIVADTLMDPPQWGTMRPEGVMLINPPYLLRNKATNKEPFDKWDAQDLYKCALLSMAGTGVAEVIAIVPSNMLFDNDHKFRRRMAADWGIAQCTIFDRQMFADTNVRICVVHLKRGKYGWEDRAPEWRAIQKHPNLVKRLTKQSQTPSKVHLRTTDTGSIGGELGFEFKDEPYYGKVTDRNYATLCLPYAMTDEHQRELVARANDELNRLRKQYDSGFLTNFLAGKDGVMRKRIGYTEAFRLISSLIGE